MIKATKAEKKLAIEILTASFRENKSTQYIIQKSSNKERAMQQLMAYSFEMCLKFGDVFISEDHKGCALVLYPESKKTTLYSIWLDVKLCLKCIGLSNIKNVLGREAKIKALQRMEDHHTIYLWFIGVSVLDQHKGFGSRLLDDIIREAERSHRTVIVETSTLKNLPWYEKFGFSIYGKLELGYTLYFLERTCS